MDSTKDSRRLPPIRCFGLARRVPRGGARGFTLLELLVALMILALSLGILLQLLSRNLQSAGDAEVYTRAVMLARLKMEEALVRETPVPAITEGALEDGYTWTTRWRAMDVISEAERLLPFELEVTVQWGAMGRPKTLVLSTVKLFPPPEPPP